MHYGVSMSEVADCTAATSHSSRATQTRGGCIVSAVLRFCSVCVSQSGDRERCWRFGSLPQFFDVEFRFVGQWFLADMKYQMCKI